MADKYINATKALNNVKKFQTEGDDFALVIKELAENLFNKLPAADVVEVKHGKWYKHDKEIHGDTCYHCSVCEKMALTDCGMVWELTPYCPFCGAKMDEVTK